MIDWAEIYKQLVASKQAHIEGISSALHIFIPIVGIVLLVIIVIVFKTQKSTLVKVLTSVVFLFFFAVLGFSLFIGDKGKKLLKENEYYYVAYGEVIQKKMLVTDEHDDPSYYITLKVQDAYEITSNGKTKTPISEIKTKEIEFRTEEMIYNDAKENSDINLLVYPFGKNASDGSQYAVGYMKPNEKVFINKERKTHSSL